MRKLIISAMLGSVALYTAVAVSPMLTSYTWENAVSGNWSNAVLWAPDGVPAGAGNSATIDKTGVAYTVTLDVNPTALDGFLLNSSDATLVVVNRSLSAGTIDVSAGTVITGATSSFNGPFSNAGLFSIIGNSTYGHTAIAMNNGMTNSGTIRMISGNGAYNEVLTVSGSNLVNSPSGLIETLVGSGGGRTFDFGLTNSGTVSIGHPTTLSRASVSHFNTGLFNVLSTGGVTVNGLNSAFNMNAGTLSVAGYFMTRDGAVFNFNGGTISGNVLLFNGAILNIGGSSTGAGSFFSYYNNTMSGNIAAAQTVTIHGNSTYGHAALTAANGFTNAGLLDFDSTNGGYGAQLNVTNGTLLNSGTLRTSAGSGGPRVISAQLSNTGTVQLNQATTLSKQDAVHVNSHNFNIPTSLVMSGNNQTFTQATGTLNVTGGAFTVTGNTFNFNGGTILGRPRLADSVLNITNSGIGAVSVHGSSGQINGSIGASKHVYVIGDSTNSHTTTTSPNTLTNNGQITMDSTNGGYWSTISVTSGNLNNVGTLNVLQGTGGNRQINASLVNTGIVNIASTATSLIKASGVHSNSNEFDITGALTMSGNGQTFNQNDGILDVSAGAFTVSGANVFNFNGGVISGRVRVQDSHFGSTSVGSGQVGVHGDSTNSGTIGANKSVFVIGDSTGGHTTMTAASGYINDGSLTMDSTNGGYSSTIAVTSGTLTNNGSLTVLPGTGGARNIRADFQNNGTVSITAPSAFTKTGGVYANSGTFSIPSSLSITAGSQAFSQNNGTLTVGGSFLVNTATLNFNGGSVVGQPIVRDGNLNFGPSSTGPGSFRTEGNSALSGNIRSGQLVNIQGNSSGFHAALTAASAFANEGTITLDSNAGGYSASLAITSGAMTNSGTLTINPGTGGTRTIAGSLTNTGSFNVNSPTTLSKASGIYTNSAGTITLASNLTLTSQSQVFRQSGGTINGAGFLKVNFASFDYLGGTINGTPTVNDSQLTIGAGAVNPATINATGSSTIVGSILEGHDITILGNNVDSHAVLTSVGSLSTAGNILLNSSGGGYNSTLSLTSGTLSIASTGGLFMNPGAGGSRTATCTLANNGLVEFNANGTLGRASATHTNTGVFRVTNNSGATITGSAFNNIAPGRVEGQGTIALTGFSNAGTVAPGLSPGKLSIVGAYTQTAAGTLEVELGGTGQGTTYDWLSVSGASSLNGKLVVKLINDYDPPVGTEFTILTTGSRTGQFATVQLAKFPVNRSVEIIYSATNVKVRIKNGVGIQPDSYLVNEGFEFSGDLLSLYNSDNNCLGIFPDEVTQVAQVSITGTSSIQVPASVRFICETSVTRTGLSQAIRMRNFNSNTFTLVDGRIAPTSDSIVDVVISDNADQFVGPAGLLEVQITWQPVNDEDPAQDGWLHCIDQAGWTVVQ